MRSALRGTPSVIACGERSEPEGVFLSLPTKNSPGRLPEEHSFFYTDAPP